MKLFYNKIYHFIGIKGTGMSALAIILKKNNCIVQGSDIKKFFFTQRNLEKNKIKILSFNKKNIKKNMIIIIGNAFINSNNIEFFQAKNLKLKIIQYNKFIGKFLKKYISFAISGSHGKTSTTGLLSHVFKNFFNINYLIGDGTGYSCKNSLYFIFEACEYKRHFLSYNPDYLIITNIDYDHPDYFKNIYDVLDAFKSMIKNTKKKVFIYGDDIFFKKNFLNNNKFFLYGFSKNNDIQVKNIKRNCYGSSFDVYNKYGKFLEHFILPLYGMHNIINALSVISISYFYGLDLKKVSKFILKFKGVRRRFAEKKVEDIVIIDDYAHHPAEIIATIDSARQKYPFKKIVTIFQPHTFSRTIALLDDFAKALENSDIIFLCDIFCSIREKNKNINIKIEDLCKKIKKKCSILKLNNIYKLLDFNNSILIFMGAGDVQKFEFEYEKILCNFL